LSTLTGPVTIAGTEPGEPTASGTLTGPISIASTEAGQLAAVSSLRGPRVVTATESGQLTALSSLRGPLVVAGTESSQVTGSSTLTGPLEASGAESGQVTAPATLIGPTNVAGTESGELTASGTLAGPTDITGTGSGELTASSTLSGPANVSSSAGGDVTAESFLTPQIHIDSTEAGQLTAPSTLTSPITISGSGAATVTAVSPITSSITMSGGGAATLTAPSTLTSPITISGSGAATITAPSTLVGQIHVQATEAGQPTALSTLTSPITISGSGAATVTALSTLVGPITVSGSGAATVTADSTLTSPISIDGSGSGQLTGLSTLFGPITVSGSGAATLTASGTLFGPITVSGSGAATLTAPATLAVPISVQSAEAGQVTAGSTLTAPTVVEGSGAATVTGPASLSGPTSVTGTGSGEVTGPSALAELRSNFVGLTVNVGAPATLLASLDTIVQVVQSLTASLNLTVARTYQPTTTADVSIAGGTTRTASLGVAVADALSLTAGASLAVAEAYTRSSSLDITIGDAFTLTSSLDNYIQAVVPKLAGLDLAVAALTSNTASLDMQLAGFVGVTAALDMHVRIVIEKPHTIDVYVSNTREFQNPLDVLLGGTLMLYTGLSATIQGEEHRTAALDSYIEIRKPYSLVRLWGDHASRFFGGNSSDANFFEHFNPHPSAVTNNDIGSFNLGDRRIAYNTPNTIPTPAAYDKYSLALNAGADTSVVGFRMLFALDFLSFGPNNILLVGGFTGTNDPITDQSNGDFVGMAIEAEQGIVHFRAWAGTNESSRSFASGLGTSRFLNVPLLVEIETVGATSGLADMEFRLYDRTLSLDRPVITIPLETSTPPTITHAGMTSLGRRTAEQPTGQSNMQANLRYLDVEPGTGSVYQTPWYVQQSNAKWRPYQDRPPLLLSQEGVIHLSDSFDGNAGYWRFDSSVPSSAITFPAGQASVLGTVVAEPSGSAAWTNARVSADVTGASDAVGVNGWFGLSLYVDGTVAAGSAFGALINTADNTFYDFRIEAGVLTYTAHAYSAFGTLVPNATYHMDVDARTDSVTGYTIVNFYLDGTLLFSKLWTSGPVAGAPALSVAAAQTTPVLYDNLVVRGGMNDIFVDLSDDGSAATDVRYDTLFVDANDPVVTVHSFTTDSAIIAPDTTNPPVVKGSLNPGFSGVSMQWSATHAGVWSLRVNSTGATNGIEMKRGTYWTANQSVVTGWDFSELPQVEGIYDVTLYLIADSGKPAAKKLGQYLLP